MNYFLWLIFTETECSLAISKHGQELFRIFNLSQVAQTLLNIMKLTFIL